MSQVCLTFYLCTFLCAWFRSIAQINSHITGFALLVPFSTNYRANLTVLFTFGSGFTFLILDPAADRFCTQFLQWLLGIVPNTSSLLSYALE